MNLNPRKFLASLATASMLLAGLVVGTTAVADDHLESGIVDGTIRSTCGVNGLEWRASATTNENNPDYSNTGYKYKVLPALGGKGNLEAQHFNLSRANKQVWRIPVATDYAIAGTKLTFTVPEALRGQNVTYNPDGYPLNRIVSMHDYYSNYHWEVTDSASTFTNNNDGTYTVDIGDRPAKSGTFVTFSVDMTGIDTDWRHTDYEGLFTLTGTYVPSDSEDAPCAITHPPTPEPTPSLNACQLEFLGVTQWNISDRDITKRTKIHNGEASDLRGEVNSDGWGVGSDAVGALGETRTLRNYAATKEELVDVTYVITAAQGFTFGEVSPGGRENVVDNVVLSPAAGKIQQNGYTNSVEGVTLAVSEDKRTIVVHVDHMQANSSLSFNVIAEIDGSMQPIYVHHRLVGNKKFCTPTPVVPELPPESSTPTPSNPANTPTSPTDGGSVPSTPVPSPIIPNTPTGGSEDPGDSVPAERLPQTGAETNSILGAFSILAVGGILLGIRRRQS